MHEAAREYIERYIPQDARVVLEIGGRDINGGLRDLLPKATWISVDLYPGPGVDIVGDFCNHRHPYPVDLVISAEVFEHTECWPKLIEVAAQNLGPEGIMLITTATGNRKPHSGIDGNELREGEYYSNIHPRDLKEELEKHFTKVSLNIKGADVRAFAQKG